MANFRVSQFYSRYNQSWQNFDSSTTKTEEEMLADIRLFIKGHEVRVIERD